MGAVAAHSSSDAGMSSPPVRMTWRTRRGAQLSGRAPPTTCRPLATTMWRERGKRSATMSPSAAVVIVSSSPESTRVGTAGYPPSSGFGGPKLTPLGGLGHSRHMPKDVQPERLYSVMVKGA